MLQKSPKGGTKLTLPLFVCSHSYFLNNKGGTGWIFKELLGCTILWATERKCEFWQQGPGLNFRFRMCLHGIQEFSKRPGLTRFLLQRQCDGTYVWMLVLLSLCIWEPSLWSHLPGKLLLKKRPSSKHSQSVCDP